MICFALTESNTHTHTRYAMDFLFNKHTTPRRASPRSWAASGFGAPLSRFAFQASWNESKATSKEEGWDPPDGVEGYIPQSVASSQFEWTTSPKLATRGKFNASNAAQPRLSCVYAEEDGKNCRHALADASKLLVEPQLDIMFERNLLMCFFFLCPYL